MGVVRFVVGWLAAMLVLFLRLTVRVRYHGDPRADLRAQGRRYAYAVMHCHQIGTVIGAEHGTGAMVSRSADGDLLIPSLRVTGVVPVRGSSRKGGQDKGGSQALDVLVAHVRGGAPAYLAVDGPRGPRSQVSRGIARLAKDTGAAVLPVAAVPTRRWILRGTWDRMQIPKPWSRLDVHFAAPLSCGEAEDVDTFRGRVELALRGLEEAHDPLEAEEGRRTTVARAARAAARSAPSS
jgi:lysophospholipid acyltransferase (LPLAT)-like uncharacterized protein